MKVNSKTLRVKFDLEWMNALNITKVPYDALSQKCKEVALDGPGARGHGPVDHPAKPPEEPYAYI